MGCQIQVMGKAIGGLNLIVGVITVATVSMPTSVCITDR